MLKPVCGTLIILLLGTAEPVAAGELRLSNGAVLPGELESIDATTLAWSADQVGKFATSLDIDRGANPSEEIKVDMTARWLRPQRRHNVFVSVDYETSDGDTTDDEADANYQYDILRDNG